MDYQVICHMLMTVDGRVAGNFFKSKSIKPYEVAYDNIIKEYEFNNVICGRVTYEVALNQESIPNLNKFKDAKISREDYISEEHLNSYVIAIDPSGKLNWSTNEFGFGEKKSSIISVLSENVDDAYLAFLQEKQISYIFAGKSKPLIMKTVLDKLNQYFGITKFFVAGGGYVNGAFLSENLIDEVSTVIAPITEGRTQSVSLVELGDSSNQNFHEFKLTHLERILEDGVWLRYKRSVE